MRVLFETGLATSKLVVTTLDVAYELGKISQDSALAVALTSLAEAQRLCGLQGRGIRPAYVN